MHGNRALSRPGTWTTLIAAGVMLLAGCQTAKTTAEKLAARQGFASADALREMGLRPYWANRLALVDGDEVSKVTLLGDKLVVQTAKNMVYTVESLRGNVQPLAQLDWESAGEFSAPTFDGKHYFFAGKHKAVGLNVVSGQVDLEVKLGLPASTRAWSDQEYLYVGTMDGKISAYNLAKQVLHWASKPGAVVTSLALAGGHVFASRNDLTKGRGELLAFQPGAWKEDWPPPVVGGLVNAPIVATEDAKHLPAFVFVPCEDHCLYCYDGARGWEDWKEITSGPLVTSPVLLPDKLIQIIGGAGNGTWVLHRKRAHPPAKQLIWKDPATLHFLAQIGSRMYFFDETSLVCKRAEDGKTLAAAPLRNAGEILPVPNPDNTRVYLFDRTGNVACFNDLNQPYLVVDQGGKVTTQPGEK